MSAGVNSDRFKGAGYAERLRSTDKIPLREHGLQVELPYAGSFVSAHSDPNSGYVFFDSPSTEELARFYDNDYGQYAPDYYSIEANYSGEKVNVSRRFISDALGSAGVKLGTGMRIHELGCAYGGVVDALNRHGFEATGSDLNRTAIEAGRKQRDNGAIEAGAHGDVLMRLEGKCDVILASHTLEHDPQLFDTLRKAARALKPGGVLFGSVPNVMYVQALLRGFAAHPWANYPEHLHMMSPGMMNQVCDDCGFEPLRVWTHGLQEQGMQGAERHPELKPVWEQLLCMSGFGMELFFVLTPAGRQGVSDQVERVRMEIEAQRLREVEIRGWLRGRGPDEGRRLRELLNVHENKPGPQRLRPRGALLSALYASLRPQR